MSRVPRIRFKGFEEDWEQRKLGEVFIYLRNNTLSREELNDEDGFAQSIHYGDVLIKYGECLNVSKVLLPYIDNKNIVNKFKKFYIQNGDVIIADTAEDETVGKCIEISGLVDHNIISGLHTIPLRPVNKFAHGYLGFYLNSNSYHNQLKPLMQGIKVTSISKNLLKTTTLNYPSNIQEQKIIGRYFDALNHLITLHQRKLEKIKIIKKSMLENLFPQNGEKTPKIRVSGFTKDWEQRKLGEYLIQYTEVTIINDQYPVLTSSRKGIFFQKDYYDGNQIASENNIGYNIVPYGYFTYRHMSDDEIFYFNINNIIDNGIVSTLYPVFTTNDRLDSKFLQYELNFGKEFRKYSVLQKQGGSRTYMYFNKLRDLKLTITTSLKEQECIRNLICSIDNLITLHQLEPFQLIFKAIGYRIIDYAKSKPPRSRK